MGRPRRKGSTHLVWVRPRRTGPQPALPIRARVTRASDTAVLLGVVNYTNHPSGGSSGRFTSPNKGMTRDRGQTMLRIACRPQPRADDLLRRRVPQPPPPVASPIRSDSQPSDWERNARRGRRRSDPESCSRLGRAGVSALPGPQRHMLGWVGRFRFRGGRSARVELLIEPSTA